MISEGAFEHLQGLKLITLGDNPWACEETANISHLLVWTKHTSARVLGCPCHIWHTCGEAHLSSTGSWHFGTYTLSPYVFGTEEPSHPYVQAVTTHSWTGTSLLNTRDDQTGSRSTKKLYLFTSTLEVSDSNIHSSTESPITPVDDFTTISTTRGTSTLRTRSVKRPNQNLSRSTSSGRSAGSLYTSVCCLLLLAAMTQRL